MSGAEAGFYDGTSSVRREVTLAIEGACLVVRGAGDERRVPLAEVRLAPRLGSLAGALRLPDGGVCEVPDGPFLDRLERRLGRRGGAGRLVHRFERSLPLAVVALLVTAALVWGFMKFGIPALAERVAFAIPPATEASLGRETLAHRAPLPWDACASRTGNSPGRPTRHALRV